MPGNSVATKAARLDEVVAERRVFVGVTGAGIEVYNFPQATRSKPRTIEAERELRMNCLLD